MTTGFLQKDSFLGAAVGSAAAFMAEKPTKVGDKYTKRWNRIEFRTLQMGKSVLY